MAPELQERASGRRSRAQAVSVTRRAADRLRAGHLWVYRSEIQAFPDGEDGGTSEPERGAPVSVTDARGVPLGSALYSVGTQIALRMVSPVNDLGRQGYLDELRRRVAAAIALRRELAPLSVGNNACRLAFSEADGLPGIVADRYADLCVVQLLTQGTAQADVRAVLGEALSEIFVEGGGTVWERTDSRIREIESLQPAPEAPLWSSGEARAETVFTINGLRFHYSARTGQKTGAFLDQRLNYAAARSHARGRALDVCTYHGGFALHLAQACERVTGVDASRAALEVADRNLDENAGVLRAEVDWIEADAFELLRAYDEAGERFDTVVLDPPAFAKSSRATEAALRGYKELNVRALRMLNAGGTLVTCSCSHHVLPEQFVAAVASAASDARRRVQVLELRGAAPDHPAILTLPETSYLKCLICRVG